MNPYQPHVPRTAVGIATVVMTLITVAVSVIQPARMESGGHEPRRLAASNVAATTTAEAGNVTRIDVVAARDASSPAVLRVSSE